MRRLIEAHGLRVDALGLRYAWLAERVGCSLGWVSQVLGRHRAGEPLMATPAIAGGTLLVRGERHLFAVGRPPAR